MCSRKEILKRYILPIVSPAVLIGFGAAGMFPGFDMKECAIHAAAICYLIVAVFLVYMGRKRMLHEEQ